ncbi:hypothetical protein [Pseudomonas sp. NPDC086278]|uniref:hypothetical protein n=1 Tax=Pseudomonas sp. NPDC086278 TaxID=3390646 RepID=UPI003CFCE6C9
MYETLPLSAPIATTAHSPLKNNPDDSLLLHATRRWREASQALQALFAAAPLRSHRAPQSVGEHWNSYWDARAPGTPMSRREQAGQLYRRHFEACAQVAFARRSLTAEQLKPLLLIIDPPAEGQHPESQALRTEHMTLILSDSGALKFPAAWVISVGDHPPVAQWLYLPSRPVPIQFFHQRSDMEAWLSGQSLIPQGLPDKDFRFEYSTNTEPMTAGITELLLRPHHANTVIFATPPDPQWPALDNDQPSLFDNLFADIPWPLRQASLNRQRDALDTLLGTEVDSDRLSAFKAAMARLETSEQAADKAAAALTDRPRVLDFATVNREFSALYQAHRNGLRAESELQRDLNQLDSDEFGWINAVLDTPNAADRDARITAARLTLSMKGPTGTVTTQALAGPFVITGARLDGAAPSRLLLYWPGTGGGLQRFANRTALEWQVFKIQPQDPVLSLQLTTIDADPLWFSLDRQTTDFEETAAHIRTHTPDAAQAVERAEQLQKLRKATVASLQVPVQAARNLAFAHTLEEHRSVALFSLRPAWLTTLRPPERARLKTVFEAWLVAMRRSHEQLEMALPPRDEFTRKQLHARLRTDFAANGHFDVQLDLPDAVSLKKQLAHGAAPGTPQKLVAIPSKTRSKLSLEALAQLNIDNTPSMQLEPLALRLGFMRVDVTAADPSDQQALASGITLPWLRKVLPELDLPRAYETLIREAFSGSDSEPAYVYEHRRECLLEPWRLMLTLQGTCAHLRKQIDQNDWQVFDIAITAATPQAWEADGKRIVLRPAYLSAGGKDTPNDGPTTLSGVTFIEEQISHVTLLYLPDSPDGQFLRRYDTLESARKALFNLCLHSEMVAYLAGRALHGKVPAHISRIDQAVLKHFDAMIGVGIPWPKTTSLAAHLLDAHMGRLIEAHRGTSRANDALYLERYALSGPRAFNYMKMALGVVPFVGTGVALYDAWNSANKAVAAFLRGAVGDGLTEVESVLLSLIDAAMDLAPGEFTTSLIASEVRALTRARQLRALASSSAALHTPSIRQARHVARRFVGYEYEQPISLVGLHPASHGLYRNIYRHADGDFIVRQGRIFQVQRSNDSRNWRLRGTRRATYKQPIALDETGQWDTWFGVYGTTVEGGGLGGGAMLGHMADALDPLWPQAIRQRLPRWWADQVYRRHNQLTNAADDLSVRLNEQVSRSSTTIERYIDSPVAERPSLMAAAEAACKADIEMAGRHYRTLEDLRPLTHGNKRRMLIEMQSNNAVLLADRYKHRVYFANHRGDPILARIEGLTDRLDHLAPDASSQRLDILAQTRQTRVELLQQLDEIEDLMLDLNHWYERITVSSHRTELKPEVTMLNGRLSEANLLYLKTGHLLETVKRFDSIGDVSWLYLHGQAEGLRAKVDRALFTQFSLPEVSLSKAQRNRILLDCLELYSQFRREMKVWTSSYPQHFYLDAVEPLLTGIDKMAERARKGIELPTAATPAGRSDKKVFTSEDGQLLIGVERWEPTTQKHQYVMTGRGGYDEIWEQGSNGKFRLLNPQASAPVQTDLATLVADARARLHYQPTYQAKVQAYAGQDMLPVDLEHMMISEADELLRRAVLIEQASATHPLIQQLRDKAGELRALGRQLRTRQSLSSRKPTDGMLDDLMGQNTDAVTLIDIRKNQPLQRLGKRADGRNDFMQEYEIRDLSHTPAQLLWYAHFHYSDANPGFRQFEKAHLKLPEHRFVTHADNAALPYADIGKQSPALKHFEHL